MSKRVVTSLFDQARPQASGPGHDKWECPGKPTDLFWRGASKPLLAACWVTFAAIAGITSEARAQILASGEKLFGELRLGNEVLGFTVPASVPWGVTFSAHEGGIITHLGAFDGNASAGFDTGLYVPTLVELRNLGGDLLASVTIPA